MESTRAGVLTGLWLCSIAACADPSVGSSESASESSGSESSSESRGEESETQSGESETGSSDTQDTQDTQDTTETEESTGGEPGELGLCEGVTPSTLPAPEGTAPGAESPFGTGNQGDQLLGTLDDPASIETSIAPGAVNTQFDLDVQTYDIHVPPDYDGTEPYGLISFINSGNNGTTPNAAYAGELAEHRLIWVAPNQVGNAVDVTTRMGLAYLGTLRAMELFNIDPTRVYAMGSSGGARSANMLAYQYPELYTGVLARCGANYPAMVEQAYETQEPDENYEYWGAPWFPNVEGVPYLDYLRGLERRFSLMTSFDDFREGDAMNIYHHGFEADGLLARLIETSGNHCSTNAAHMHDGLGFVDHPLWPVVVDEFDDGEPGVNEAIGDGWLDLSDLSPGASLIESESGLHFGAEVGMTSAAIMRNRSHWDDRHGMIVRAELDFQQHGGGRFELGVVAHDSEVHDGPTPSAPATFFELDSQPAVFVAIAGDGDAWQVQVELSALEAGLSGPVFVAGIDDWTPDQGPLQLKLELWDNELQLDLDAHLLPPIQTDAGVRLLDDQRTVRVRWDELLGGEGWSEAAWSRESGSVLSLAYTPTAGSGSIGVGQVSVVDGVGFSCE